MKKLLFTLIALIISSVPAHALGPFIGYVQISTGVGIKQSGGFNVGASTVSRLCFDDATCQATAGGSGGSGITGDATFSAYGGGGGAYSAGSGINGFNNTAIGFQAMGNVTDKNLIGNIAIGTNALFLGGDYNIAEFSNNLAIGYNTLKSLANFGGGASYENVAIGNGAMTNSVQSADNTCIGYLCMGADTGGSNNVAIGVAALSTTITSGFNTAIGWNAGGGDGNHPSRDTMATAVSTTLIGASSTALHPISANPFISPQNTVAIGYHSTSECTDCLVVGATDIGRPFRVAIGSTSVTSSLWINSFNNIQYGAGGSVAPPFDNLSIKVTTSSVTSNPDFVVDVYGGVRAGRSMTAAQIKATASTYIGMMSNCSDCSTVPVCISTGTAAFQWALITNRASACN